jgi:antitoxin component YwqK of YwqJK toxin-antitoxin module
MKRIVILLGVILICQSGISQEAARIEDGYHIFKYPNGSVSSEGIIKNGKPEGFWKSYYVTGVLKSEGKRTNFMLDSIWVFFDQAGDTTEKISFLYGKKNGWYLKYKKDAEKGVYVYSRELFAGDKKEGTGYIYFPDGKIKQTINFNNGKKEGLSKEYNEEGKIISLLEYSNDFLVSREKINRIDQNGLKQGDWKEYYKNGIIKCEKSYIDDQLNGYYKEYNEKGKLVLTMLYDKGAIVKSNVEDEPDIEVKNKYDSDGNIIYSGPYRDSVPVGIHREFNKQGDVTNAYIYNDNGLLLSEGIVDEAGNRNGKWKDLYNNGKIKDEGQYLENRRTGQWKFFNEEGKTEQIGSYKNGRPEGMWTWYYENGTVRREEEYFQGRRDGLYTEYSENGEIIAQGQYADGEKNGIWKYKYGDFSEEGSYIMGLRDGLWRSFFNNGKPKFKGSYVQGNPDGKHTYYYDSGKIKEEQYYNNGIKQRTWKKNNEDGSTKLLITYKDDVEVSINGVRIKLPKNGPGLIK